MSKQHKKMDPEKDQQGQAAFPGYPLYPSEDDILRRDKRMEGNLEDEGINDQSNVSDSSSIENQIDTEVADELEFIADEFGVTKEDLEALGPLDLSMDLGEDEQLKQRTHPVDFAGENLDVPGTADDDAQEEIGAEDEENNSYSVGGDGHTDLEEGRQ